MQNTHKKATKPFSRLLRQSARERGGLILQGYRAQTRLRTDSQHNAWLKL